MPSATTPSRTTPWAHAPSRITLLWLGVSLPLIAWDTGYVLLRPRSMPGGDLQWPLWMPYELYGSVDGMYGWRQWDAGNGFTAAQAAMNIVESVLYVAYVWVWWTRGRETVATRGREVSGKAAGVALVLGFSAAVMTLSKTVLYWINEYFSDFINIRHNDLYSLIVLWMIPNGLWLIFPTFMIWSLATEIVSAVQVASDGRAKRA